MDYASRASRWLLGASDHPGGAALTEHLLEVLEPRPGAAVLDVASGRGATLAQLRARGHRAVGVDVRARALARQTGVAQADAHALPVRTASVDAVLVECSLSTFDDPARAAAEVARVLVPGGRVGVTDVLLDRDRAPAAVTAAVDRLTRAGTLASYAALLETAGLRVTTTEDRQQDAVQLLRRLRRRLPLSRVVRQCERAVADGSLGYGLVVAERVR